MKKLLVLVCMLGSMIPCIAHETWPHTSQKHARYDRFEYKRLMKDSNNLISTCAKSIDNDMRIGPIGCQSAIFLMLRDAGTPASLKVLKDLVAAGKMPASFLEKVHEKTSALELYGQISYR